MAKRFIDTGLFKDSWFSELSANNKLFYVYLITNCDHAGIIDLNPRLAEFETGIKGLAKGLDTVKQELGDRLYPLRDNYYFLVKFVKYQYPRGLAESSKPQNAVIKRLHEFGLDPNSMVRVTKEYANSLERVQDKDKDKDKDKDSIYPFDQFWNDYNKKTNVAKSKERYDVLNETTRAKIKEHVPEYVKATPDKQYRKDPTTYLNNKSWLDEDLPISNQSSQQPDTYYPEGNWD